jgi:hypothetical protein
VTSSRFDTETLELLDLEREVEIETTRPDGSIMRTIVWVVVDEGEAFVRSWRGARSHWFHAALDRPAEVGLLAAGRRLNVQPVPAADDRSIARCSSGFERKYAGAAETSSMVREEILGTTLRLEPR